MYTISAAGGAARRALLYPRIVRFINKVLAKKIVNK